MKRVAAIVVVFLFHSLAHGQPAISSWRGAYEYQAGPSGLTNAVLLSDGVWEKYSHGAIGARLAIATYWNSEAGYALPANGSRWTLDLKDPATERTYANFTFTYDEASNCLNGSDGSHICDAIQPRGVYGADAVLIDIYFRFQCMKVMSWKFSASTPEGLITDMPFNPIRYRVKAWGPSISATIQPHIPATGAWNASGPETTKVWVVVTDDQQCGFPIENATVDIETRVTGSAGHAHFSDEAGTGKLTDSGGQAADSRNLSNTHLRGQTDAYGKLITYYTAGEMGVVETVKAKATQDAVSAKDPASTSETSQNLEIRYPWLVEVPELAVDGSYVLSYTATGCPHAPQAHWLNYGMRGSVLALAARYKEAYGAGLSLNDGSLAYGGLIDNKLSGGRDAKCHVSHRRGIDVDLNSHDAAGVSMNTAADIDADGGTISRLTLLNEWAADMGIPRYVEENSLHYRWQ